MALLSTTAVLLGKELRTEFRSRELLTTTVVFILIVIVLFSFTFEPTSDESRRIGPGLLWLAFLFAASLMLQPCFLREQNNDTLSASRLSVRDPFAIFLSKLCANTLFLLLTELLLLPVFSVLYNVPLLAVVPQLGLVFFLGSLGLSVTGTTLSAISAQARTAAAHAFAAVANAATDSQHGSDVGAAGSRTGPALGLAGNSDCVRRHFFDGGVAFRGIST